MDNQTDNQPEHSGLAKKNPLTWVMFIIAALVMVPIKISQSLRKRAYDESALGPIPWLVGMAASAGAGVLLGSSVSQLGIEWWLGLGVGAVLFTYYYAWPALYLAIFRWSFKFSTFLWKRVPTPDARGENAYGVSPWLSKLLVGVSYVATVLICCALWWNFADGIHTKLDWGDGFFGLVAWVISAVVAAVISVLIGGLSFSLISQGMPAIAVATGGAIAYGLSSRIGVFVHAHDWAANVAYGLEGAVFVVWTAYAFPLGHLVVSRLFRGLGEYLVKAVDFVVEHFGDFLESVYSDKDKRYVGFTRDLANIALAAGLGYYAYGHEFLLGGSLIFTVLRVAVPVVVVYLLGGHLLRLVHNGMIATVASAFAGYVAFGVAEAHGVPLGVFGAGLSALVTFVLGMGVVFPIAYTVVKALANPLLASWLAEPLHKLHETLSEEIFSSVSNTYEDKAEYGKFFAHAVGILITAGGYLGLVKLVALIGFSTLSALIVPIAGAVAIYLAAGKLFVRYGNVLIGTLLAIGFGVFGGIGVYQHFEGNIWWGIAGFFASALGTAFVSFPVSYVVARALLNVVKVTAWALPVIGGVHGFFFGFVETFWDGVVAAYRVIEAAWIPAWRSVSKMWDESWADAKRMFEEAFGKKK